MCPWIQSGETGTMLYTKLYQGTVNNRARIVYQIIDEDKRSTAFHILLQFFPECPPTPSGCGWQHRVCPAGSNANLQKADPKIRRWHWWSSHLHLLTRCRQQRWSRTRHRKKTAGEVLTSGIQIIC